MDGEHPGWHYRLIDAYDDSTLSSLGAQGWEVVATGPGTSRSGARLCLKRARPTFRERVTLDQKRHVYAAHGIPLPEGER